MPTHQCLGLEDGDDIQDRWEPSIELDEKPAIAVGQPGSAFRLAPQNNQLLPERRVLGLKPTPRLEWRKQYGQHKREQRDHDARLADFIRSSTRMRFSAHTGFSFCEARAAFSAPFACSCVVLFISWRLPDGSTPLPHVWSRRQHGLACRDQWPPSGE